MGLFDAKYKKEYEANTTKFQSNLSYLQELATQNRMSGEANKIIVQIQYWLGETSNYPNGNKDNIINIDKRINDLLAEMSRDIQEKSSAGFAAHALMVLEAVQSSRKFGKEPESAEYYIQSKACSDNLARLTNNNRKIQEKRQRMLEIEEESETMDETDIRYSDLDTEYTQCEEDIADLEQQNQTYTAEYENSRKVLKAIKADNAFANVNVGLDMKSVQDITNRLTTKALERGRIREEIGSHVDTALDTVNEVNGGSIKKGATGGLAARRAQKEQERLNSQINSATVNVSGDSQSGAGFGQGGVI